MSEAKKKIKEFKAQLLAEMLATCSQAQQDMFNKQIFPNGVPDDKYDGAIDLIERTIKKNKANPDRLSPPPSSAGEPGCNSQSRTC